MYFPTDKILKILRKSQRNLMQNGIVEQQIQMETCIIHKNCNVCVCMK